MVAEWKRRTKSSRSRAMNDQQPMLAGERPPVVEAGVDCVQRMVGLLPPVLDVCCSAKMMWWNKHHPLATYMDKHAGNFTSQHTKLQRVEIAPDVIGSYTNLPYPDNSFYLVVFDPPHFETLGKNSKIAKIYGELVGDWRSEIRQGFQECFRVLKPYGTLIFKWSEMDIAVEEIVALAPQEPLFGHRTRRHGKTHWMCFMKPNEKGQR